MLESDSLRMVFKGKDYSLKIDKLLFVLSALKGEKVEFINQAQIENLMQHYCLYDEHFLENINKLKIEDK